MSDNSNHKHNHQHELDKMVGPLGKLAGFIIATIITFLPFLWILGVDFIQNILPIKSISYNAIFAVGVLQGILIRLYSELIAKIIVE